jgi:Cu+-exporting ATPase
MLLSPIFAAAAMALSSVFVLGNALRLKRFRAPMALESRSETTGSGMASLKPGLANEH